MILLLFFVINLVKNTDATVFCNRHFRTSDCSQLTSRADCELHFSQNPSLTSLSFGNCQWYTTSSTCYIGLETCKPSCFANNKKVATCANSNVCNFYDFIGGYGDSQLCAPLCISQLPSSCACTSTYCDWTCSGKSGTSNCGIYNKYNCHRYRYYNNSGNYGCQFINNVCVLGEPCIPVCTGSFSTNNCSSISFNNCGSFYTSVGSDNYNCIAINGLCYNGYSYPNNFDGKKCYVQLPINPCVGTASSSGCVGLSESQCDNKWELNSFFGKRQCKYDYGLNQCIMKNTCS